MNRNLVIVGLIFLLILSFSGCIEETRPVESKTIYVDDDGDKNFTSIQDAIKASNSGDTIYVYSGIYYEQVLIDKSIDLIGENEDTVIIDGGGNGTVVTVSADRVNISGFTIQNSGEFIRSESGCCVEEMTAGIRIDSNYNTISGNTIINNEGVGILLDLYSSSNAVDDNIIIDNNVNGIVIAYSENNVISNNTIAKTRSSSGISLAYGSSDNKIVGNVITNNVRGIAIIMGGAGKSCNNYISDNTIADNTEDGIDLGRSSYTVITRNEIANNRHHGINLSRKYSPTTYSIISENNIIGNGGTGIYMGISSDNNTIHHNNFVDNNQNAYDLSVNSWDYGSKGNYWDDYSWVDKNNDGIGDTSYDIPGGESQDRYPVRRWI